MLISIYITGILCKNSIVMNRIVLFLTIFCGASTHAYAQVPQVLSGGQEVMLTGTLPEVGIRAPSFELVDIDLTDVSLEDFKGQVKILNIVPSLDTTVCALSAIKFNEEVGKLLNTVIINVSMDLPFANKRFCELEHIKNIRALSAFRSSFGQDYGFQMKDGALRGLLARAVMLIDMHNVVRYVELVPDLAQEPNYEKVLAVLQEL